jgi:uncharacterized protein involved in exopolysaccharide biosynthesis
MAEIDAAPAVAYYDDQDSVLSSANVLLRRRRLIVRLATLGAAIGLTWGLLSPRLYMSSASFIPQQDTDAPSGAAALASQFGIRVAGTNGPWGPAMYAALLRSRALLEPMLFDTVTVVEEGRRRSLVIDLLRVNDETGPKRIKKAVEALTDMIAAREENRLGAVQVEVTTRWPSVSEQVAQRLLQRVNLFNFQIRKSQATAERQFVEGQTREAEISLREAENRLQDFLSRNRAIGNSPELSFERDRLQREVNSQQSLYTSWLQRREDARIREIRDIPVITVLEQPEVPTEREARGTVKRFLFGGLLGATIGVVIAFISRWLATTRNTTTHESREFFELMEQATPRFIKRIKR